MLFGKKKNDEKISIDGFAGVLHKSVMFISYPFRKPLAFVVLLLVLAAAAVAVPVYFYKVQPAEIHIWYKEKAKNLDTAVTSRFAAEEDNRKGVDNLVEMPQSAKEVRRRMFEKAARFSAPQTVDVMSEEASEVVELEPQAQPQPQQAQPQKQALPVVAENAAPQEKEPAAAMPATTEPAAESDFFPPAEPKSSLLSYLEQPEIVTGRAKVYNANELEVNGTYMFLYGIYANPNNAKGVKAAVFLRSLLKGAEVSCRILAYTQDNVATGECFVGEVSINKLLVQNGFSQKVTLQ